MEEKDIIETADEETENSGLEETEEELAAGEEDDSEIDAEADETDDEEDFFEDEEPEEESEEETTEAESQPTEKADDSLKEAVGQLLTSLGAKNVTDPVKALKQLTAETMGISLQELERRESIAKAAQEKWDEQAKRDIDAIHEAFPETAKYKSLRDLPNKAKFAQLMDNKKTKLTAVEAFAASHPDIVVAHKKLGGRGKALEGTKAHITSSVPKGAKDTSVNISKKEMQSLRETFGNELSDSEIKALYRKVTK